MKFAALKEKIKGSPDFSGTILENELLSLHSTMNVGGPARLFIEPSDAESLMLAVRMIREENIEFFILGGGSNTIFCDEGLGCVVSTRKMKAFDQEISVKENSICVSAGCSWGKVISFCKNNDTGGFESFTGLSGTAGGAVYMNATCFGLTTSDRLICVNFLDLEDFELKTYCKIDEDWGYKKSPFQKGNKIILSAEFSVTRGFDSLKSSEVLEKRNAMGHFKAPSAGSAFKNKPEEGIIAGKLIDECGLKGFAVGGAQIAPWHGNFIINPERKATSFDINALVKKVQEVVLNKKGVLLEPEILFV